MEPVDYFGRPPTHDQGLGRGAPYPCSSGGRPKRFARLMYLWCRLRHTRWLRAYEKEETRSWPV